MTMLLLAVIYIAFISLGIPDSLIGAAWPAIYPELAVSEQSISIITVTVAGCTVLSSVFSAKLLLRFGTAKVTIFSTLLTAAALFGFGCSGRLVFLWLLAIPLGLGAGAIDSGLNNYIALHYSARHMNFLHAFYGIGVSFSPYVMGTAIRTGSWHTGYKYAAAVQLGITLILFASLPLWKKCADLTAQTQEEAPQQILPLGKMVKDGRVRLFWVIMFATNALELACGSWGATYLVEGKKLDVASGATLIALFYIGMALGRLLAGIFADKISQPKALRCSLILIFISLALMILPLSNAFSLAGLFLIGFGNGPIYPALMQRTPQFFEAKHSQSIMGTEIAAAYLGVMLTPPLFGAVSGWLSICAFPYFLAVWYLVMTLGLAVFLKKR